jgi:hypothetical protein
MRGDRRLAAGVPAGADVGCPVAVVADPQLQSTVVRAAPARLRVFVSASWTMR